MRPPSRRFAEYTIISKAKASSTREGLDPVVCAADNRKKRTIRERKRNENRLTGFPILKVADPILIERKVGEFRRFRNLGFNFASKGKTRDHTRSQRIIDYIGYPESSLYESHEVQTGSNPAVLPRYGIYPGCVIGDWRKMTRSCDRPQRDRQLSEQRSKGVVKHTKPRRLIAPGAKLGRKSSDLFEPEWKHRETHV